MTAAASLRLPGVYFLPAQRAAALDLPPLDVTGFVGFATRGPLNLPVPVEDLTTFDAIFGGPLAVARDADGSPVYAYLRDAVAGFFSSGGRRCYAVRIAGSKAAPARFAVFGLAAIDDQCNAGRAEIDASSPGAWGEELGLGAVLATTLLPLKDFEVTAGVTLTWTTTGAPQAVQQGDVLRLTFEGDLQHAWLFPVAALTREMAETPQVKLRARAVYPLRTAIAASLPPSISAVQRMTLSGLATLNVTATFNPVEVGTELWITGADRLQVSPGDMLRLDLAGGSQYLIAVADAQVRSSLGSLPGPGVAVTARDLLSLRDAANITPQLPVGLPVARVERLQLSLRIKQGTAPARQLDGLGFNDGHTRFWRDIAVAESGSLAGGSAASSGAQQQRQGKSLAPGDATKLYAQLFCDKRADIDWTDPRYMTVLTTMLAPDLATCDALVSLAPAPATSVTYLPVGMPLIASDSDLVRSDPETADDGLQSFGSDLFLDPNLARISDLPGGSSQSASTLLSEAKDLYYAQDVRLKGIHSLMFTEEVALISVPDAIQRGWTSSSTVPALVPPTATGSGSPISGFRNCAAPPTLLSVDPPSGPVKGGTPVTITGSGFQSPDAVADVQSVTFAGRPALSIRVIDGTSLTCETPAAAAAGSVSVAVSTSTGTAALESAFSYVQPSTEPRLPTVVDIGSYQVHPLHSIHASLIRLCEARADAVAILSLPLHFEKQDCIGWLQGLRQLPRLPRRGVTFSDARQIANLSYAAVYHPWLLVSDSSAPNGALHAVPPDGPACGAIAAREMARRVWVAPANVPLPGVLDLQPNLSDDDWAALFSLGFNLIRTEAKDFRVMSAHTLAEDNSLLQLSVRRLLIQLRKAILERGQDYVFAKNDDRLREQVRQGLENLLRMMFAGGAFAGVTQQSSYRIAVDDSLNSQASINQGRVIAQVLVAPSQPMEFLTVLLTRTGEGQLRASEG